MKYSILNGVICALATVSVSLSIQAGEQDAGVTPIEHATIIHATDQVTVQRIEGAEFLVDDAFITGSQSCTPHCSNPLTLMEDVRTVGELEVIEFMQTGQYPGKGMIVDTRSPDWHERGTIPGSVNLPFALFEKSENEAELVDVLERLGARQRHDVGIVIRLLERIGLFNGDMKTSRWDFTDASDVLLWCNDPWCGQAPRAIKALLSHGYPAEKLYYYRGGMQTWQSLGLATITITKDAAVASR